MKKISLLAITLLLASTWPKTAHGINGNPAPGIYVVGVQLAQDQNSFFDHSVVTAWVAPGTQVVTLAGVGYGEFSFGGMTVTEKVPGPTPLTSVITVPPFKGSLGKVGNGYEGYFSATVSQNVNGTNRTLNRSFYIRLAPPFGGEPYPSRIGFQIGTDQFFPNFSLYDIQFNVQVVAPPVATPRPSGRPVPPTTPTK